MPLKGQRYLPGCTDKFIDRVENFLPYASLKEALDFYERCKRQARPSEWALLGCNDRFWLLSGLCHREDTINPWYYDRCREVESDPDGYLDLWARWHGKSSIITFAGVIQEILIDPEITVGIFSNSQEISKPFLAQIKEELEGNDELKQVYPDVLWQNPKKEAPTWSLSEGIVVKREGNPKERTVEAHGLVDALPTGRHFKLRVYDDIVTEKSVTTPEMVQKTTQRWELSDNLGVGPGSREQYAGTRYSFADTYGIMIERQVCKVRLYPATHNGQLNGKPILMSEEEWADKKNKQRSTVAAQMLLNPLAGEENTFEIGWLRPYELRPTRLNVYIVGDPSLGRTKTSDRTAIAVIGVDRNMNRYLLDGYCHRMRLAARWAALRDLYVKWRGATGVQAIFVGWERYGLQADTEYFEEKAIQQRLDIAIDEVHWTREGPQSKLARVGRLEPYFRNSQFWMPPIVWIHGGPHLWTVDEKTSTINYRPKKGLTRMEQVAQRRGEAYRLMKPIRRIDEDGNPYDLFRVFAEEFQFFPFAPRDDLVDAISRIEDLQPTAPVEFEKVKRTARRKEEEAYVDA